MSESGKRRIYTRNMMEGYNPDFHQRRSLRLKDYDYSQAGAYFVTICTHKQECIFGDIVRGDMHLNTAGMVAYKIWTELPIRFQSLELDKFVIMPNHILGIISLVGAGLALPRKGAASGAPTLGDIIRVFKSVAAIHLNRVLGREGRPFWQRNYYEHVIRNETELSEIREYIVCNPLKWELDRENPQRTGTEEFDDSLFGQGSNGTIQS